MRPRVVLHTVLDEKGRTTLHVFVRRPPDPPSKPSKPHLTVVRRESNDASRNY